MICNTKNLFQNLTIFSDGSFLLNLNTTNINLKNLKYNEKDFKFFQQILKKKSVINLNKIDNTIKYRKKLFK